jgi:hypothetical protein
MRNEDEPFVNFVTFVVRFPVFGAHGSKKSLICAPCAIDS